MGKLDRIETPWTAASFLVTDQRAFGDAWRYELVDGVVIAHAAPAPRHGELQARLALALGRRLDDHPCKLEIGSGATPRDQQRATARIPDLLIRCSGLPRVIFEVVSPSELRAWRARNRKRRDAQDIDSVQEIVEVYQDEPSAHLYRRGPSGVWLFEAFDDLDAVIPLTSVDIEVPLAEVYKGIDFDDPSDT
jgi:Uma2 family endonuclease